MSTQNKKSSLMGKVGNSLNNTSMGDANDEPFSRAPPSAASDVDMKNLLGYLNQSEWIYSLNIGNIMQISPLTLQDFMSSSALEMELSREYVLEKVNFYF